MIQIEKINTLKQAQKFSNQIIKEPKTYFLQGSWGSGKTEYLTEVEKIMKEKKFKFVKLELWNPKNKFSVEKQLFSTIHPIISWIINALGWCFIIASVIGSIILAIRGLLPNLLIQKNTTLLITMIAVILTTLYSFIQSKWLEVDRLLMFCSLKSLRSKRRPKVLVVDDFDRLNDTTQKELYIIFNAIHEKTRVIFIGDLSKIENIKDNYLGKVIDQKISLPFSLHSKYVAQQLYEAIVKVVKEHFNFSIIKTLFTEETRTARDANQFLFYVENEYIEQDKLGRVQIDQHLFVVYLYLFHPEEYKKLLDGWLPEEKKDSNTVENINVESLTTIENYMCEVFQPRTTNPIDYRQNTSAYLLNEFANNRSIAELKEIITLEKQELRDFFLVDDEKNYQELSDYAEFLDFVNRMGNEEYRLCQKILEKNAIIAMRKEVRHKPNKLINAIFYKRYNMANETHWEAKRRRLTDFEIDKASFEQFEQMFIDAEEALNITITDVEKMYYYRSCLNLYGTMLSYESGLMNIAVPVINEKNVAKRFSEISKKLEASEDFGKKVYDAEVLIIQLGYHYWLDGPINVSKNPDFKSKVEAIEKLSPEEYCSFWEVYEVKPAEDENGEVYLQRGEIFRFDHKGQTYESWILERLKKRR